MKKEKNVNMDGYFKEIKEIPNQLIEIGFIVFKN